MSDVSELFYKVNGKTIEGYLNDINRNPFILFVLREPNSGGYDKPSNEFWMKRVIDPRNNVSRSGKYLRTLGTLAAKLKGEEINSGVDYTHKFKELLNECAYINIYPFSGSGKAGVHYYKTETALFDVQKGGASFFSDSPLTVADKENYDAIAKNRLQIIKDIQCKYVVTVCGAYEAIVQTADAGKLPKGIHIDGKDFRITTHLGKPILSYYHPGARHIQHETMNIDRVSDYYIFHCEAKDDQ
ncbi:MAG: hypothetical protein II897_00215 [Clostridia bacterium]|nr:hypothetical protein [Clostridia bacterium]